MPTLGSVKSSQYLDIVACPLAFPTQTSAVHSRRDSTGESTVVNSFSQSIGMKNMERKREKQEERQVHVLSSDPKTLSLMNMQGSGGVTSRGPLGE